MGCVVQGVALDTIISEIRTATTSMTSVPQAGEAPPFLKHCCCFTFEALLLW